MIYYISPTKPAIKATPKPVAQTTAKPTQAVKQTQQATTKAPAKKAPAVTTAKPKSSQNVIHKLVNKLVAALKPISKIVDIKKEPRSNATTARDINPILTVTVTWVSSVTRCETDIFITLNVSENSETFLIENYSLMPGAEYR